MKKNRSSGFMLLLLLVVITIVHAQQKAPVTAEDMATKTTAWMKTNLNLNEDQIAQANEINLKFARKNMDLKKSSLNKKQKLQTLQSNEDAKEKELKRILSADQYKTWLVKKEEVKEQLKENNKKNKT